MLIFDSRRGKFGTQKPKQWGSLSSVQSAVRRNVEILGIDPGNIVGYWPLWDGTLKPANIITGDFGSDAGAGVSVVNKGLYQDVAEGATDIDVDGYDFVDNVPFWFAFGIKKESGFETSKVMIAGKNNSTSLNYIGIYSNSYLRVRWATSTLFNQITDFSGDNNIIVRCDGTNDANNALAVQNGDIWQYQSCGTNTALGLNHFGIGGTVYGINGAELHYWLAATGDIPDDSISQFHDAPYLLLQPNPAPVYLYFEIGGTTYYQSVAGDIPAMSGIVSTSSIFSASTAGNLPAPTGIISKQINKGLAGIMPASVGTIAKLIKKGVAGNLPTATGSIAKLISKALGGLMPAATGETATSFQTSQATAGILGALSGILSTVLNPVVSGAGRIVRIIGSNFRKFLQ